MASEIRTYRLNLREVLGARSDDDAEREMQQQLTRIYVLYQDLLFEVSGAMFSGDLAAIPYSDMLSRRFYFVRRALGTLWEIKQACDVLNRNGPFKALKRDFATHNLREWDESVKFFQANQVELKIWRNTMGGHFTDDAADFVLKHMPGSQDGDVVVELDHETQLGTAHFPFAAQIVAVALGSIRREDLNYEDGLKRGFLLMQEGNLRSIRVGQVLTTERLLRGRTPIQPPG